MLKQASSLNSRPDDDLEYFIEVNKRLGLAILNVCKRVESSRARLTASDTLQPFVRTDYGQKW